MPVRRIISHPKITTNHGKVALQRGPVIYCLEGHDNGGNVLDLVIPDKAEMIARFEPDLLGGVVTIHGDAETAGRTLDGRIVPEAGRPFVAVLPRCYPSHLPLSRKHARRGSGLCSREVFIRIG